MFAVGDVAKPDCESVKSIDLPYLLSFLAAGDFTSKVRGVQELLPAVPEPSTAPTIRTTQRWAPWLASPSATCPTFRSPTGASG